MDRTTRLKRLGFRAHHRGIKEGDLLIGGFFTARSHMWDDADCDWFEALLEEQDVDILAWAMQNAAVPERFQGPMMEAMQRLDFMKGKA